MEFDLDRARYTVEDLLTGFLAGALGVELIARQTEWQDLPAAWRARVQLAEAAGRAWVAWSTPAGPVVAWGSVDAQGSKRIGACLLLIEWDHSLSGHRSLWAYCDPKRPTEWTIGRGWRCEPHSR